MKNKKQFLIFSITSLVILNLSMLMINFFSLTLLELDSKIILNEKISEISNSKSKIVNSLLKNTKINDPIIQQEFEYLDRIKVHETFLINNEGKIIIHRNQKRINENLKSNPDLYRQLKSFGDNKIFTFNDISGKNYICSSSKLKDFDMYVITTIDKNQGMASFKEIRYRIISISLIISLIGSIIMMIVSYKYS